MARRQSAIWRERLITLVCGGLASLIRPYKGDIPPTARVLIVKPCCLGDVLLATATIAALANARPDLKIDFLVSDWARPALENNPRLARLVSTGVNGSKLGLRNYLRLARQLRQTKYDAAIVLDRSPLLGILGWLAGIPIRIGLDSNQRGFALNVRANLTSEPKHEAELYLDTLRAAGLTVSEPKLEYYPTVAAQELFLAKAAKLGLDLSQPLVVIHPGGGDNPDTKVWSKRWPPERFGHIASRLVEAGYGVIVIGAKSDHDLVKTVIRTANNVKVIGVSGEFDLATSAALFQKAQLFIGNDTGFMHLAVACGTSVVAIFGPSSPILYRPYSKNSRAVAPITQTKWLGLALKEYQTLSVAEGGIEAVNEDAVWQAIIELVGQHV